MPKDADTLKDLLRELFQRGNYRADIRCSDELIEELANADAAQIEHIALEIGAEPEVALLAWLSARARTQDFAARVTLRRQNGARVCLGVLGVDERWG